MIFACAQIAVCLAADVLNWRYESLREMRNGLYSSGLVIGFGLVLILVLG